MSEKGQRQLGMYQKGEFSAIMNEKPQSPQSPTQIRNASNDAYSSLLD